MTDILPLLESAEFFGIPVPKRRLRSWAYEGLDDGYGGKIRLRTRKIGGRRYVRREWVEEFLRLTSEPEPEIQPKPTRADKDAQEREIEDSLRRLRERHGLKV